MTHSRRNFIESLALLPALPLLVEAQEKIAPAVLRGRIINLAELAAQQYQVQLDTEKRGVLYCLKTSDGKLHPVLPTDTAAAIYEDERYRKRELQITARTFAEMPFIEVIKLQSVKWGRVYDLYFYCVVCNIKAHKGGPCECCQDPLVFTETPAENNE